MIDIHSHILPGLDDGAKTLEDSVAMVRLAAETGTTDIVATPHANLEYSYDQELVDQKIEELREACGNVVRIYRGCDFHLHYDNIQDALANPAKYAVNQKSYLLVEFSELLIARTTDELFHRLRLAGLIPIITHPERNHLLQQRIELLEHWARAGCYLQVTALSLLGRFGKRAREFSEELMRRRLVHIVASDAHDPVHRPARLDETRDYVTRRYGARRAERLFELNPRAVIEGASIAEDDEPDETPKRKWYRFWK